MSNELVTVATFNDPIQAAMARNYLEAGGVRAFLVDEMTVTMGWGLGNAIGGIKLQVKASHVERAEALLNDLPGDDPEEELPAVPATAFATPEMAEQLREERDDLDPKTPVTAFATAETAEALREEREGTDPKTLAVERLFRTTVFGLLFWPLQFYALWLLMALTSVEGKVSPHQRWKVAASLLLNLPLLVLIIVALFLLAGLFQSPATRR
jgi:Fe-S-cluster formation regulator IscX/YfhJ